jgi:hypothetical protein
LAQTPNEFKLLLVYSAALKCSSSIQRLAGTANPTGGGCLQPKVKLPFPKASSQAGRTLLRPEAAWIATFSLIFSFGVLSLYFPEFSGMLAARIRFLFKDFNPVWSHAGDSWTLQSQRSTPLT